MSPDARWAAARDAAGQPGTVPALAEALARESDLRVREAIFTALAADRHARKRFGCAALRALR